MTDPKQFDELVAALREAFFALRAVSTGMLADLDCTPIERGVLSDLASAAQTVPALAQARAVSRQAMQKVAGRLLARRLVSAEENPRHQRSPLLALTPAGKKLFAAGRARERRLLAQVELPLSDTELRRTARALRELARLFADPGAPRSRASQRGGRR